MIASAQVNYLASLRKALSEARLAGFSGPGEYDDLAVISRYAWNLALCRALYPALQAVEVALRNRIYAAVATFQGSLWLTSELLAPPEQDSVAQAVERLKAARKPPEPDRLVAELNFGFWASLFLARYEQVLWPKYLRVSFPEAPARERVRRTLCHRLDRIRILRNRVFHHEPIWHRSDLAEQHQQICEMIGWLCPPLQELVSFIDDFPETLSRGSEPFKDWLREFVMADRGAR
jgi:hypothetical protein